MANIAIELASAYVSVIPEVKGISRQMSRQLAPGKAIAASAGRESGSRFSGAFRSATSSIGRGLATSMKYAAAGAAVGIGAAGAVGLKTAAQLETAQIGFTTMLGSGEKARKFLGDLSTFAAKTPFGLPGLQKSASSLVAIGIKSKDVIPIMTTLGNITSGMGTGAEGVDRATRAIQQMNAAGKITAEDLNQLRDAGVPVYDLLTKATGKTTKQIAEMRDKGELGRKELDALMELLKSGKGLERFNGLMQKQSQSLAGLSSTFYDTFSVGLAKALKPVIPLIKDGLAGATKLLADDILPRVESGLAAMVKWGKKLDFSSFSGFVSSLTGSGAAGSVSSIGESFKALWPAVQEFASQMPSFTDVLKVAAGVFGFLADNVDTLIALMPVIVGLFVAFKAAQVANNLLGRQSALGMIIQVAATRSLASSNRALAAAQLQQAGAATAANTAQKVSLATRIRSTVAAGAHKVATLASAAASKTAAVAQRVLNSAMRANPIGIIVTAITVLVGALVWFFTQTKLGKKIWQNVWGAIKHAASVVVDWFVKTALPWLKKVWDGIAAGAKWLWKKIMKPAWAGIKAAVKVVGDWFANTLMPAMKKATKAIGGVFEWLWEKIVKPVFRFIKAYIKAWWVVVKAIFKGVGWFIENVLGPVFRWLWNKVIKPVWGGIKKTIKSVWEFIRDRVFGPLKTFITKTIPDAFEKGVKGIEKFWNKLENIAKKPVRFVVEQVLNKGLFKGFNNVMDFIGSDLRINPIQLPKGFRKGGYTGDGPAHEAAGVVHKGEYVLTKEQTRAMGGAKGVAAALSSSPQPGEAPWLGTMQGVIKHFGNRVTVEPEPGWFVKQAVQAWQGLSGLNITAGYSGTPRMETGKSSALPANVIAFATSLGNSIVYNTRGVGPGMSPAAKRATSIHEIGHLLGLPHTNRRSIMQPVIGGHLMPTAFDAENLQRLYGPGSRKAGEGGGGNFNPLSWVAEKVIGGIKKLIEGIPGAGMMVDLVSGMASKILGEAKDWALSMVSGEDARDKGTSTGTNKFGAKLYDQGGVIPTGTTLVENRTSPEALLNPQQWATAHKAIQVVERGTAQSSSERMYLVLDDGTQLRGYVRREAVHATGQQMAAAQSRVDAGGKYTGGLA